MATERVLSNLNLISFKTEGGLQNHIDELQDGDLAFTPDNSLKGNIFDFKWADHLLNDISWLRADTFSWQSGDVYVAAYNHLVADFEGTTAETETIGDIEITFYRAEDKHKICLPDQEDKVLELYNATGVAWYYILDTANKQFKLPRSKHNKYADTLGVVGNGKTLGLTDGVSTFGIAGSNNTLNSAGAYIARSGNDTLLNVGEQIAGWTGATANGKTIGVTTDSTKSGIIAQQEQDTDQYKYLYFYVGNFERDAVEQTAGINTETFNNKADRNLMNTTDNVDMVIESQLPTVENGYTWYRKYKSGWVEQGGIISTNVDAAFVQTLPIVMANNKYNVLITRNTTRDETSNLNGRWCEVYDITTTTFTTWGKYGNNTDIFWQVSGMSAQ